MCNMFPQPFSHTYDNERSLSNQAGISAIQKKSGRMDRPLASE